MLRYNKRHAVHIFTVGGMVSISISREDRAKADNKQKVIAKPQSQRLRYTVLTQPTKDLQPATDLMGLKDDIPGRVGTPEARQTTLPLLAAM